MKVLITFFSLLGLGLAVPVIEERAAAPTVTISYPQATIIGKTGDVEIFPGIPFAKPPVGALRFKPPQPLTEPQGTIYATENGKACPQFTFSTAIDDSIPTSALATLVNTPLFQKTLNFGEDCLVLNIHRPKGTTVNSKLPVLFWIYGGGFQLGWNYMYDGAPWVSSGLTRGQPIILVTVNYRVGAFGFLPGKEVLADGSSNIGLLDQRLGLQWVADNIGAFGGDPTKVTIWGESAGAISVFDHMALYDGDHTYKGKPLFRGAIMNSGSIVPADPIDCPKGQKIYDTIVSVAGCSKAYDTLSCLREAPYEVLLNATSSVPSLLSYSSISLSYLPRPDGKVLVRSPDQSVLLGKFAKVPFIVGDQEDEGTLFALFQSTIKTIPQLVDYLKTYFFHGATTAQIQALVDTYPDTTTDGSPFRTSIFNNWYPQFKRLAAILGDLTFTISRRAFLDIANLVHPDVPSWSYLASYDYGTPILGTFHGSDLLQVWFGVVPNWASISFRSYYLNFVTNLDPNVGTVVVNWPRWSLKKKLLSMYSWYQTTIDDNFRDDTYQFLLGNINNFHI
ncbi:hypothetical protein TWF481_003253 [Arthrobotrys musiformis]|uniref:Carboxylic ester hydrolase n=1 Tax=Arthrobotrys musiformis TaxID=47236 RepID=A0AAV9VQX6_9PEZI